MKKLAIMILAAALVTFGFSGIAYAQSTISKAFTTVTGPDNTDPVPQGLGEPTLYEFIVHYGSNGGPAVTIRDIIPNGFDTVTAQGGNCKPLTVYQDRDRGTTKISCKLPAATDADILVRFQTRTNPSTTKGSINVYEPTECTLDGFLLLNDGAMAVGPENRPVAGPTPPLSVAIQNCPPSLTE